jgi:hypothetical protein
LQKKLQLQKLLLRLQTKPPRTSNSYLPHVT